jgi:hypothetical protein
VCTQKNFFLYKCKKKGTCGRMRELMTNKNIYLEFIFDHIIGKNSSPQVLQFVLVFYEFSGFSAKNMRPISSQGNDSDGWFFLPQIQLVKLYKIGYLSVDSETLVVFLWETPWNRPWGLITFFAITQEAVDQSFSSSSLDRHIYETVLRTKFHHNRISLARAIV